MQSDQKFLKNRPIFHKVTKIVSKPKIAKIKQSSNWKSKISTSNHLWNLKYLQHTMFWHAYLGEIAIDLLKHQNDIKCPHYFGLLHRFKKSQWTSKSSPIGKKLPNLLTLIIRSLPQKVPKISKSSQSSLQAKKRTQYLHQSLVWNSKPSTLNPFWRNLKILKTNHVLIPPT